MHGSEMQAMSRQVEGLLDEFRDVGDPVAEARAEELVRSLMALYAAALDRVLEIARDSGAADGGETIVRALADDDLVGSLLILHDLHPDDVDTRIQAALDRVRPYLGSHAGGIDYVGVDEAGVAHLTLQGSCNGCPSSSVTVTMTVESAVLEAAPEVSAVEVVGVVAETKPAALLQIGLRPGLESHRAAEADPDDEWGHVHAVPDPGIVSRVMLGSADVLLANLGGTAYAYRDACPRCLAPLSGGRLDGDVLACPSCAARFDVRLAGRGLEAATGHLTPLPMLPDGHGWKVAMPGGVPA
ncbi:MAG: NifU family protein [Lapillicoccus sp.]